MLGVLGPSGSGKSTLARLLVAAMPALSGKVRLDGADMHQWDKGELGRFIGYLPQDVQLLTERLPKTLRASLSRMQKDRCRRHHGRRSRDDSTVAAGLRYAVGEGGARLSGGQKQRVALARAIYNQPRLIVMDEPNASLDDDGEKALLAAIAAQQENQSTQILITHKPALLSCANKLLVLRAGRSSISAQPSRY